jgi:hypothetical protein
MVTETVMIFFDGKSRFGRQAFGFDEIWPPRRMDVK